MVTPMKNSSQNLYNMENTNETFQPLLSGRVKSNLGKYSSKSSHYAQRLLHGSQVKDIRYVDPETNRYIGYSPRTRKAMEAIGDIKMMLNRRRELRNKLHANLVLQKEQQAPRVGIFSEKSSHKSQTFLPPINGGLNAYHSNMEHTQTTKDLNDR